jgi:hypothetical protein
MNRKTQISLMLIWSVLLPISVHASGDYLSSRYIGCFRDDGDPSGTGGRDLSEAMIEYDTMNKRQRYRRRRGKHTCWRVKRHVQNGSKQGRKSD